MFVRKLQGVFLALVFTAMVLPVAVPSEAVHATACTGVCCEPDVVHTVVVNKAQAETRRHVSVNPIRPDCGGGGASPCSTSSYYYATGVEDDGYESYGVAGTQVVYGATLPCGSSSDGSGVAYYVNVYFGPVSSFTGWAQIGYYQGYNSELTAYTASPHYYLEVCSNVNDCPSSDYLWDDLSTASGVYPSVGSTVTFLLSSDCVLPGSCPISNLWSYYIIVGSEIVISGEFFAPGQYGSANSAAAESHNVENIMTGKFTDLQVQLSDGGSVPWAASYSATTGSPYNVAQCSTTEFTMWTTGGTVPSC